MRTVLADPAEMPGVALPLGIAIPEGIKTALLTILVYLVALPFVLFAGAGFVIFFIATAWLLGREYFELAAMRFRPPAEAKAMRKQNAAIVFTAGLVIAAFVAINTWAAVPKPHSDLAAPGKAGVYRSDLWMVY